jgi:hypothetical protein
MQICKVVKVPPREAGPPTADPLIIPSLPSRAVSAARQLGTKSTAAQAAVRRVKIETVPQKCIKILYGT